MNTFKDCIRRYNIQDDVPTLQAMQKVIQFYHDGGIYIMKLECTRPNVAYLCLHKSTYHKFYPFFEGDKDLCEKAREEMNGGTSIGFTPKAVVDQTFFS